MAEREKSRFGMIGMAVMGRNLALNILDHGTFPWALRVVVEGGVLIGPARKRSLFLLRPGLPLSF